LNLLENLEDEMTRDEIMQQLNLKDRKNFRENYLNPAIDNKLIELTIPDKPQSSKQKYRVTSNGKELCLKMK
jgi:ATP-dependent DNA helicase RecG